MESGGGTGRADDTQVKGCRAYLLLSSILRLVLASLLLLYLILPPLLLLFVRYPEIAALLAETDARFLPTFVLLSILVAYKFGARGLVPLLALAIGALKYQLDANLWRPPPTLNLAAQVAVITGGNAGLGLATAKALVQLGAHVVITCRNVSRCERAANEIAMEGRTFGGTVETELLDLSGTLQSVVAAAERISTRHPQIQFLFNNAGSTPQHSLTKEGLEDSFGGMHLAHTSFVLALLPSLKRAGEDGETANSARIVMVSSEAGLTKAARHYLTGIPAFHPSLMVDDGEGDLRGEVTRGDGTAAGSLDAYARAKLGNILFAKELNRRLRLLEWQIGVCSLHTGAVATKTSGEGLEGVLSMFPGMGAVSKYLIPLLWRSPEEGAQLMLRAAFGTDPTEGGQYLNGMGRPLELSDEMHERLKALEPRLPSASWPEKLTLLFGVSQSQVLAYALRLADETWSRRLWGVSLRLLEEGSASGEMVEMLEAARR